jgi:CRISPR-associated protein Cas4
MDLRSLIHACSFKLEFVEFVEGTDLVVVKQRDRVPGFIYVSDLSQFLYCPRRFYLSYRAVNIVDKIKFRKIREKLQELKTLLREGAVVYDRETFRRILVGTYVHRAVENAVKMLNLKATYRAELEVVDKRYGVIGHVDLVKLSYPTEEEVERCVSRTDDEELCSRPRALVFEIKSGLYKTVPEEYKKQAQFYAFLLERNYRYVIDGVYIVHPVNPSLQTVHGVNIRFVEVEYSPQTAKELIAILEKAREVLLQDKPPRVEMRRDKCERCAYKLICLY